MNILLTFYNSKHPFVIEENGEYFIFRHPNYDTKDKYTDELNILLNAVKNVKHLKYLSNDLRHINSKEEYWQYAFNYMYSGGGLVLWQNPTNYWESELCRRGQLPCKKCGNPTIMYYTPTCFSCERPEPDKRGRYYLMPVCYYIAIKNNLPPETIEEAILDSFECHNDSILDLYSIGDEKIDKYLAMVDKEFPIETTNFYISW